MAHSYRTSNRHSVSFKFRRGVRRTRTRVITTLIQMLEGDTRAAA
jgi:hypothetical protein